MFFFHNCFNVKYNCILLNFFVNGYKKSSNKVNKDYNNSAECLTVSLCLALVVFSTNRNTGIPKISKSQSLINQQNLSLDKITEKIL